LILALSRRVHRRCRPTPAALRAATLVDPQRIVLIPVVAVALVLIEPRRGLIAPLIGVGERTARLREQAVVETLLQLPCLTKPTGSSLSGHLVTYLSYLGLRRSPLPCGRPRGGRGPPILPRLAGTRGPDSPPTVEAQSARPTPAPTTRPPPLPDRHTFQDPLAETEPIPTASARVEIGALTRAPCLPSRAPRPSNS